MKRQRQRARKRAQAAPGPQLPAPPSAPDLCAGLAAPNPQCAPVFSLLDKRLNTIEAALYHPQNGAPILAQVYAHGRLLNLLLSLLSLLIAALLAASLPRLLGQSRRLAASQVQKKSCTLADATLKSPPM